MKERKYVRWDSSLVSAVRQFGESGHSAKEIAGRLSALLGRVVTAKSVYYIAEKNNILLKTRGLVPSPSASLRASGTVVVVVGPNSSDDEAVEKLRAGITSSGIDSFIIVNKEAELDKELRALGLDPSQVFIIEAWRPSNEGGASSAASPPRRRTEGEEHGEEKVKG